MDSNLIKSYFLFLILFILNPIQSILLSSNRLNNTRNVTAMVDETAILRCKLSKVEIGDNLVMWIRKRDNNILTVGLYTYTSDSRISAHHNEDEWILKIKNVQLMDSGLYECRMSSDSGVLVANPTFKFILNVLDASVDENDLKELLNFLTDNSDEQQKKIKKIINTAEDILRRAEDESGNVNPSAIVNEFLSDPFPIKDFNISDTGSLTYFEGNLQNMTINGLKQLNINNMIFNLGYMQLKVLMDLPSIQLEGIYQINGKATFFPFYGDGNFWMNVSDLEIHSYSALNRSENDKLQVGAIDLDVMASNIDLHFENLMGGGLWSSITNTLLNRMSNLIFDHVKHTMLDEASHDIKNMINKQLAHLEFDVINEKSSNIFDDILKYSTKAIRETGLDPLKLPSFKDKFNYNMLIFALEGQIEVFEGNLHGLSTLIRTGDIIATYNNNNNEVIFEASMGFSNLTGGYKWKANVMGGGPSGSASLSLSTLSCYLKIKQNLKKGMRPSIESFKIERIKHLWVDVDGLGSWDFILEIIMNLVSNAFKVSLANAISGPVTHAIQKELNHLPISFL